jgi:hypothetical protein
MQAGQHVGKQVFPKSSILFIVTAWIEWFDDFP